MERMAPIFAVHDLDTELHGDQHDHWGEAVCLFWMWKGGWNNSSRSLTLGRRCVAQPVSLWEPTIYDRR